MPKQEILVRALIVLAGMTLAVLFLINLCDLIFQCGCRSTWNGAAANCNIHDPSTHDCPWCVTGRLGYYLPLATIFLFQVTVAFWPGELRPLRRLLLTLVMFPAAGALVGVGFGLATGYWSG